MSKTTWTLHWKQVYTPNFVEVSVSSSGCNRKEILCCHSPLESCTANQLPPNGHDLLSLNKLMRESQSMPDLCWWIVSVPSSFVSRCLVNRPDGSSASGHVIMAAHPNILHGVSSTVSVLAWNSRKIRRLVRSSLGY